MLRPVAIRTSEATEAGLHKLVIAPSSARVDLHVIVEERWHFRVLSSAAAGDAQCAIFIASDDGEILLPQPVAQSQRCTLVEGLIELERNHARLVELGDRWMRAAARAAVAAHEAAGEAAEGTEA